MLVADWLKLPENAAILSRYREKLPIWRDRAGPTARELEEILEKSGGTQPEGPEWEHFKAIGMEYALRGNLCPFNEEGRCEIYPVRPTICRAVHVLETSQYCTPGRGQFAEGGLCTRAGRGSAGGHHVFRARLRRAGRKPAASAPCPGHRLGARSLAVRLRH